MWGWLVGMVALLTLIGCANPASSMRLVQQRGEVLCKHCNCLMPASVDPETMCPVCNCKRRAHDCVRGH